MSTPHEYIDKCNNPFLEAKGETAMYEDPDYIANDAGDQLPLLSTVGAGPRGEGLLIDPIASNDSQGTFKFGIKSDRTGELIVQTPNLHSGRMNVEFSQNASFIPEGDWQHKDEVESKFIKDEEAVEGRTVKFYVTREGNKGLIGTTVLPEGAHGTRVFVNKANSPVQLRSDNTCTLPTKDLFHCDVQVKDNNNQPMPRIWDVILANVVKPNDDISCIGAGLVLYTNDTNTVVSFRTLFKNMTQIQTDYLYGEHTGDDPTDPRFILNRDKIETNRNKVTSISSSSTDKQYPSAKCLYTTKTGLQANIDAEESARISAINTEKTQRQTADSNLQTNINNEASARESADNLKVDKTTKVNGHALSGNVTVTKGDVGLGNVDNTSDANKPVSTATQTALDSKVNTSITVNGHALSSNVTVTKGDVGLGNVDNTSDANKPVSTATQSALNAKQNKLTAGTNITIDSNNVISASGGSGGDVTGVKGNSETNYRTGNVNITKANIGLGNVDNTSDTNKPISTATQTALNGKVDNTTTVNGHTLSANVTVTKSDISLGSVVNTGDSATPVSGGTTKFTTGGAYTELNKKLDKIQGNGIVYINDITGSPSAMFYDSAATADTFPIRDSNGCLYASDPTASGHAVTKYYGDTTYVTKRGISDYFLGVRTKTLLWTNSSPSSSFAAQTISMPELTDYDSILIVAYGLTSYLYEKGVGSGVGYMHFAYLWAGEYCVNYAREYTIASTSIVFGDCRLGSHGGVQTHNDNLIPYKIYGLKYKYTS